MKLLSFNERLEEVFSRERKITASRIDGPLPHQTLAGGAGQEMALTAGDIKYERRCVIEEESGGLRPDIGWNGWKTINNERFGRERLRFPF
jgi:hypothetical protein